MASNKYITDLDLKTRLNTGDYFIMRDILESNVGSKDKRYTWGSIIADYLTTEPVNWWGQLAKIETATSNEQAVLAVLGDSWTNNGYITQPLNNWLQTTYGNAGPGYVGIGMNHGSPDNSLAIMVRSGTWTDRDNIDSPVGKGVDIAEANSSDTSTPGQAAISGAIFNTAIIHFLKQSGGGDFRYRVDGGSWTTVSTSNASDLYSTVSITGLSTATHTMDIQISSAGSSGVTMFGIDLQRTGNGVRLLRIGNSGATAAQYASQNSTLWAAAWTALAPTAVAILLGTNDMSGNVAPSSFGGSIDTLCTRIQAAVPLADVFLLSPADNGLTGKTYTVSQYRDELRNAAVRNSALFIDTYRPIGSYTNGNSRGLYLNTSHLNANGGRVVADMMIRRLKAA